MDRKFRNVHISISQKNFKSARDCQATLLILEDRHIAILLSSMRSIDTSVEVKKFVPVRIREGSDSCSLEVVIRDTSVEVKTFVSVRIREGSDSCRLEVVISDGKTAAEGGPPPKGCNVAKHSTRSVRTLIKVENIAIDHNPCGGAPRKESISPQTRPNRLHNPRLPIQAPCTSALAPHLTLFA